MREKKLTANKNTGIVLIHFYKKLFSKASFSDFGKINISDT